MAQTLAVDTQWDGLRKEDTFFEDDGVKNLVARTMHRAVLDARKARAGKLPRHHRDRLLQWTESARFEIWADFVGLDADHVEERIKKLVAGR